MKISHPKKYMQAVTISLTLLGITALLAFAFVLYNQPKADNTPVSKKTAPIPEKVKKNALPQTVQIAESQLLPKPLPHKTNEKEKATRIKKVAATEPVLSQEDEQAVYLKAQVFRDEALATFPVHTVEIHVPKFLQPEIRDTHGRSIPSRCPPENEIWVRVKPGNVAEMKEIMAQTADLYRVYVQEFDKEIRVVNWVNGQPWAVSTYKADGSVADVR